MRRDTTLKLKSLILCLFTIFLTTSYAGATEESAEENASNPLAKVKNTDLRYQYFDMDGGHVNDVFIDGAFMALDSLKIKYELHYWETDLTGTSENNLESSTIKAIYFPTEGAWGEVTYRVALGLDWIVDFGDEEKGVGSGSDQLGPFVGLAMGVGGVTLIPLVQHFSDYSGESVNTTAFRFIALKPLPNKMWIKLDAKVPVDWEHDNAIPANAELQLGKSINKTVGIYFDGLLGIGSDRPYDWGLGTGIRFSY